MNIRMYPNTPWMHLKPYSREVQFAMFTEAQAATLVEQEPTRYEALIRVSQAIGTHRDPAELFRVLTDELRKVIKFDAIGVVQYDEKGNEIAWHLAEKCKEMSDCGCEDIPQEETIPWWVYQHQEPLVITCLEREARFPRALELIRACGIQSGCALPLTTVHRRLGVLFLGSEESKLIPRRTFLSFRSSPAKSRWRSTMP